MDKKILLTGATGGIGSSIANDLISSNHEIIFTSSKEDKLTDLKKIYGDNHHYYNVDLSNMETLPTQIELVTKNHNNIDIKVL